MQTFRWLDEAHPTLWRTICFTWSIDLNVDFIQKHPGCLTGYLGTPWPSQVDTQFNHHKYIDIFLILISYLQAFPVTNSAIMNNLVHIHFVFLALYFCKFQIWNCRVGKRINVYVILLDIDKSPCIEVYHFTIPPAKTKNTYFFTTSPTEYATYLLNCCHVW